MKLPSASETNLLSHIVSTYLKKVNKIVLQKQIRIRLSMSLAQLSFILLHFVILSFYFNTTHVTKLRPISCTACSTCKH